MAETRFVLVAGTGKRELPPRIAATSEELGEQLARAGFGLVTSGWKGVDATVASAFARTLQALGVKAATRLTQIVKRGVEPAFPGGEVITAASDEEGWERSIEEADAVVLVGGIGGTYETGKRARLRGKPVLPLADTAEGWKHADARRLHAEMRERWDEEPIRGLAREDFIELASPAPGVVLAAIRCLETLLGRQGDTRAPTSVAAPRPSPRPDAPAPAGRDEASAGASPAEGHVFLCYARTDLAAVDALDAALRAQGVDVWVDRSEISSGSWKENVTAALDRARALVVWLTPLALASEAVRRELAFAARKEVPIIPVVPAPIPERTLPDWYAFDYGELHRHELSSTGMEEGARRLAEAVRKLRRPEASASAGEVR